MNAKAKIMKAARIRVLLTLALPFLYMPGVTHAQFYNAGDPLDTTPPLLRRGAILPSESTSVQCNDGPYGKEALSLNQAVDLALCHNPQIKASWASIKLQAAQVGEASAAFLPTMSATVSQLRTRTGYPDSSEAATSTTGNTVYATLAWRIFDFGTRAANRASANSLLLAATANHDAVLQKTLTATIQAYFDLQVSSALIAAREQNRSIAQATVNSARRREALGTGSRSDTLQALTALSKAELERNRSLGNHRKANAVLAYLLGLPTDISIVLPMDELSIADGQDGKAAAQEVAPLPPIAILLRNAKQSHPAIMAAQASWQAAESNVTAARAEALPTIDVSANHYKNGYPGQSLSTSSSRINSIGISLNIPLFDGFARGYKIKAAQAQMEQRQAELTDTRDSIEMEIVKADADTHAAWQNLQASRALLDASQAALATSQRKYEKGATDILEILNTQNAVADARQERLRCVAEWHSARLRLMSSAGTLGKITLNSKPSSQ